MKKAIFAALLSPFFWGDWLEGLKVNFLKFSRTPVGVTFQDDAETADFVFVASGEIAHYPQLKEVKLISLEEGALIYAPRLEKLPESLIIGKGSAIHYNGHYVGPDLKPSAYMITIKNLSIIAALMLTGFGLKVFGKSYRPYRYKDEF